MPIATMEVSSEIEVEAAAARAARLIVFCMD
jgi:hypothetical protein